MESDDWKEALKNDDFEQLQKFFHLLNVSQRMTALNLAGESNSFKCVEFLVRECSFDVENYVEIFDYSLKNWKSLEILKLLIHSTIDIVLFLVRTMDIGREDVLKYLISDFKKETNEPIRLAQVALGFASSANDVNSVKYLIEQKVNLNAQNENGATSLWMACYHKNLEVIKLLIDNGADVDLWNNMKESPLSISCLFGSLEIVKCLIRGSANVNTSTRTQSALHIAISGEYFEIVKCLVEAGADIMADSNGITALSLAKTRKYNQIEKYLIEKGAK